MWDAVTEKLGQTLGKTVRLQHIRPVSGGCIHQAHALKTDCGAFFAKTNQPDALPMFEAEAEGLNAIAATGAIRCPEVIFVDQINGKAVLILEFIEMTSAGPKSMNLLGGQLAELHRNTHSEFGWSGDNHIGLTAQKNALCPDWVEFFRTRRLEFQFKLCRDKGLKVSGADRLLENLEAFFDGYQPVASLLHGDLWGGNVGFDLNGNPVIFDPACYYGDRETDLAFTEMFGGFSLEFHQSYRDAFPIDPGYTHRKRLYNLYHELNHFYLFGGGYGNQARSTVDQLLRML